MDDLHLAIGVTGVVALIVVIANSMSYVGGRVADQSSDNISDLVTRGGPVADQLTAVEGELALLEGEYMDATCSAVQSIGSTACAIVGPLLPRLPSLRKLNEEEKYADAKPEPEPEPPGEVEPAREDPPVEE